MVLIDEVRTIPPASQVDYYLIESTEGEGAVIAAIPDRRSIETFAKLNIINTAANHPAVDVYFVEILPPDPENPPPDDPIADVFPLIAGLPLGVAPAPLPLFEGSYDVYITDGNDKESILLGPVQLDLLAGDVTGAIIYDNPDPDIVDLVVTPSP